MLHSMTGFSRTQTAAETHEVIVEMKSVNHRFLDVKLRGNISLSAIEHRVRSHVSAVLGRGRIELNVRLVPKGESVHEITIDRPLMSAFVRAATDLAEDTGIEGPLTMSDLIGFSPAFQVKERELFDESTLWEALEPALDEALSALQEMRRAEGVEMEADLESRIETLGRLVDRVEGLSEERRAARQSELEAKVAELMGDASDRSAISMDVARLVERADIAEELTRFRSHVELWTRAVKSSEPCGKKLDFIVQEMNREVNTVGSKCQDKDIAEQVIAMKSEIERVREQVQNIE